MEVSIDDKLLDLGRIILIDAAELILLALIQLVDGEFVLVIIIGITAEAVVRITDIRPVRRVWDGKLDSGRVPSTASSPSISLSFDEVLVKGILKGIIISPNPDSDLITFHPLATAWFTPDS